MKRKIVLIIVVIFGLSLISVGLFIDYQQRKSNKDITGELTSRDENKEADKGRNDGEEGADVPIEGEFVSSNNINLNNYSTNIILAEGGEYFLTGNLNNSIFVDSEVPITLNLSSVNINTAFGAAIANVGDSELIINVISGTNNVISVTGEKTIYDGALFSNGPLSISGTGTLHVYANQKDGEGIATKNNDITINESNILIYSSDDGINAGGDGGTITINSGTLYIESKGDAIDSNKNVIINGGVITAYAGFDEINTSIDVDDNYAVNGGVILATGTDRLILPDLSSSNKIICFEFVDSIPKNELITLVDENGNVIFSLNAKSDINTVFYASNNLQDGKYYLYSGGVINNNQYTKGEFLSINNNSEYIVKGNINSYIEN